MHNINDIETSTVQESNSYALSCFIFAFFVYLLCASVGWNHTILDNTGHRQTQTAINTYYILRDGLRLDYETPVLGKPWSIPHELPIYEWLVAAVKVFTPIGLDQCGRLISMVCFILSLIPLWFLLGRFINRRDSKLLCLTIVLASPVYMFWSRTFMIESLALLLSLSYLALVSKMLRQPSLPIGLLVAIFGTLAGLAKVTTFIVSLIPVLMLFIWSIVEDKRCGTISFRKIFSHILYIFVIPLLVSCVWVVLSDHIKILNPIGHVMLTSSRLRRMIFGSLQQRLVLENWRCVAYKGIVHSLGCWPIVAIPAICLFLYKRYRIQSIACTICFIAGPILFFNLYLVHEYYCYASNIFLLAGVALALIGAYESHKCWTLIRFALFPAVLASMYSHWWPAYGCSQAVESTQNKQILAVASCVKSHTAPNEVIVIDGWDWNPSIPYYSQRRALMRVFAADKGTFEQAIQKLSGETIGAFVIIGIGGTFPSYIEEQTKKFDVARHPVLVSPMGDVYVKAPHIVTRERKVN